MNHGAVTVPLYRLPLSGDEMISLSRLREILGKHPIYFIVPAGLHVPDAFLQGEMIVRFPDNYFTYPFGYNRLLMTSRFYRCFKQFSHILIYQLDCLVFRDELDDWCSKNYDFIGAPWLDEYRDQAVNAPAWKVGNGGFSLRKVSTALKILSTRVKRGSFYPMPPAHFPKQTFIQWFFSNIYNRFKQHLHFWTVEDELHNYAENEDRFWAIDVININSRFTKPDVDEAFGFAFEVHPRECLAKTDGRIPFGCHAWWKYDRELWESILTKSALP